MAVMSTRLPLALVPVALVSEILGGVDRSSAKRGGADLTAGRLLMDILRIVILLVIIRIAIRMGVEGTIEIGLVIFMAVLVTFIAWAILRVIWNVLAGRPPSEGLD